MDPASSQHTANSVVGNQTPPLQASQPSANQISMPSLLDKINSHQFDEVTTQLNGISTQPTQPQQLTDTSSQFVQESAQNQDILSSAVSQLLPIQNGLSATPTPDLGPVNTPQTEITQIQTNNPSISQSTHQPTQPPSLASQNSSFPQNQPQPVPIEYPGEVSQQPTSLKATKSATEITLPTLAETQPVVQNVSSMQIAKVAPSTPQQSQPIAQSTPLNVTPSQFGSPFASVQQSVIPPLKPVIPESQIRQDTITSANQPLTQPVPETIVQSQPQLITTPLQSTEVIENFSTGEIPVENIERFEKKKTLTFVIKVFQSITTGALTFQGLRGLYSSLHFIIVEFPIFEQALNEHQLGEETVNTFAIKAGLMILSTAVSLFFAVQLAIFRNKTVKILNIVIGMIVTIASILVMRYAQNIHILDVLPSLL